MSKLFWSTANYLKRNTFFNHSNSKHIKETEAPFFLITTSAVMLLLLFELTHRHQYTAHSTESSELWVLLHTRPNLNRDVEMICMRASLSIASSNLLRHWRCVCIGAQTIVDRHWMAFNLTTVHILGVCVLFYLALVSWYRQSFELKWSFGENKRNRSVQSTVSCFDISNEIQCFKQFQVR